MLSTGVCLFVVVRLADIHIIQMLRIRSGEGNQTKDPISVGAFPELLNFQVKQLNTLQIKDLH